MVARQGEVWWADLPTHLGSEPGYRHPVLVAQSDSFNESGIQTVVCVVLTSNLRLSEAPGNVYLAPQETGLPRPSVANVSQIATLSRPRLRERVGKLPPRTLNQVFGGVGRVLGVEYWLPQG